MERTKIKTRGENKIKMYLLKKRINLLFYGNWAELHGLDIVTQAIILLKKHKRFYFTLIGSKVENQIRQKAEIELKKNNAKNYTFKNSLPRKDLIKEIQKADWVLAGGYEDSTKSKIIIRNSTFECIALGKPVIIPDTPANRELLENGVSALMCKLGDSKSLAGTILNLDKKKA